MKKKHTRTLLTALLFLCVLLAAAVPAQAASRKKQTNTWTTKKGYHYYHNAKGKKATGMVKIGSRYYYFDKNGIQRYGWKKVKNDYYFFRISTKAKAAYRLTSTKVNGIALDAQGRANKSGSNLRKLKLMVAANETVERITSPGMNKMQRLQVCFNYAKKNFKYYTWRQFSLKADWEKDFAEDIFFRGGRGDCFSYGAAFAYLANAVGMKDVYIISSGGHGWAEIKGKVYDPDWALVSNVDSYFKMSYDLSGVNGRPLYKTSRAYAVKL